MRSGSCIYDIAPVERHRTLDKDGTITANLLVPPSWYEKLGNTDASKNFGSISMSTQCVYLKSLEGPD